MKTQLHIEGMTCAHCARHVKEALEALPGVKSADVNLAKKSAAVEHGEGVSGEALKQAVSGAGYEAV